jgi:hypothetical protein
MFGEISPKLPGLLNSLHTPLQLINIQIFTSSGTYNPSAGVNKAFVECWGGGGGGGGSTSSSITAGGGGAGAYAAGLVTISGQVTITIGAAGTNVASDTSSAGGNGGNTSFGSSIIAAGGSGGAAATSAGSAGGAGGTIASSTGTILIAGGGGGPTLQGTGADLGIGGSSPKNSPVAPVYSTTTTVNNNTGQGGFGGFNGYASLAGATGYCVVFEYGISPNTTNSIIPLPTQQIFTSGSGTYNTPTNVAFLEVIICGGGGGGAGSGTSPSAAGAGGNTTFGSSFLTANGGGAGQTNATSAGGTATGGNINIAGGTSSQGGGAATQTGMAGVNSPFGGAGCMGGGGTAGQAATGYGSGGGGAGDSGTASVGGGGAAGGWVYKLITNPSSSYAYSVGGVGSAGGAGASGTAGGAGASGIVWVKEYYSSYSNLNGSGTAGQLAYYSNNGNSINGGNLQNILGVVSGNASSTGHIGEVLKSQVLSGSAVSVSNNSPTDITTLALSAGNWIVWGNVHLSNGSGNDMTACEGWINSSTATAPDISLISHMNTAGASNFGASIVPQPFNFSSTTTLYLSCLAAFSAGSVTGCGIIYAERVV